MPNESFWTLILSGQDMAGVDFFLPGKASGKVQIEEKIEDAFGFFWNSRATAAQRNRKFL